MDGLWASIGKCLSHGFTLHINAEEYRHDKRRKYDFGLKND